MCLQSAEGGTASKARIEGSSSTVGTIAHGYSSLKGGWAVPKLETTNQQVWPLIKPSSPSGTKAQISLIRGQTC